MGCMRLKALLPRKIEVEVAGKYSLVKGTLFQTPPAWILASKCPKDENQKRFSAERAVVF